VIIKDEQKNRNHWRLAIVTDLIVGRDDVARGARLKTAKGSLERAIQQLCPLELSCDTTTPLNSTAETFEPRAKRGAAVAARLRIQQVAANEQEDN
jgi:hypothetical protein